MQRRKFAQYSSEGIDIFIYCLTMQVTTSFIRLPGDARLLRLVFLFGLISCKNRFNNHTLYIT
jgi:hypothetical protein